MNKEEITSQLKEILNKYPNKQLEILFYVFGRDNLMKIINEPTYEELQQENQQLKGEIEKQFKSMSAIIRHNSDLYIEETNKIIKENYRLRKQKKKLRSWLEDKITDIVPKGCGINYNCEYDSEEDYIRAMEEKSRLNTLKEVLSKLNELEECKNE